MLVLDAVHHYEVEIIQINEADCLRNFVAENKS
jgi:hypothetical protein